MDSQVNRQIVFIIGWWMTRLIGSHMQKIDGYEQAERLESREDR